MTNCMARLITDTQSATLLHAPSHSDRLSIDVSRRCAKEPSSPCPQAGKAAHAGIFARRVRAHLTGVWDQLVLGRCLSSDTLVLRFSISLFATKVVAQEPPPFDVLNRKEL